MIQHAVQADSGPLVYKVTAKQASALELLKAFDTAITAYSLEHSDLTNVLIDYRNDIKAHLSLEIGKKIVELELKEQNAR